MTRKALAVASLSGLMALYAVGLIYEGFFSPGYFGVLTFPFVDKAAAERAYRRLAASAPAAVRVWAAQRLIESDPTNPESWVAVAKADLANHGGPTSKSIQALDHSYAVSFFDRPDAVWRVNFALENWPALSSQLQSEVLVEAKAALEDPTLRRPLKADLMAVQNPEGRTAAGLVLAQNPN